MRREGERKGRSHLCPGRHKDVHRHILQAMRKEMDGPNPLLSFFGTSTRCCSRDEKKLCVPGFHNSTSVLCNQPPQGPPGTCGLGWSDLWSASRMCNRVEPGLVSQLMGLRVAESCQQVGWPGSGVLCVQGSVRARTISGEKGQLMPGKGPSTMQHSVVSK